MTAPREYEQAMKEYAAVRKLSRRAQNIATLQAAGVAFTTRNGGDSLLFRAKGKPEADFYPATGRWRSNGKIHTGDAPAFLAWYERSEG